RTIRSARRAISLLWVIITTVCRNSALVRLISPSTSVL
ncbi:YqzL-like protein, partial [Dysosmobacter welbionis]